MYVNNLIITISLNINIFNICFIVFESMFDSSEVVDYSVYEYKLIMGLGLMSIDFPKVQSRVGDKGGLKVILGKYSHIISY